MRLPRVRITVRRMMVAVALSAFLLGAVQLRQRRANFLRMATHNAHWEAVYSRFERGWEDELEACRVSLRSGDATAARRIAEAQQTIKDASIMKALFTKRRLISERVASHPWELVPPDPLAKKPEDEAPFLLFEPWPGLEYAFSPQLTAILTLGPISGLFAYAAFLVARRRIGRMVEGVFQEDIGHPGPIFPSIQGHVRSEK